MGSQLKTCVYKKAANKDLLLHYESHADTRYKRSLLMTMLNRAHCLSSSPAPLAAECDNLGSITSRCSGNDELALIPPRKSSLSLSSGRIKDRTRETAEIELTIQSIQFRSLEMHSKRRYRIYISVRSS